MKNLIQQGLALRELLRERILVLDGAMGTMLQQENLTAADFGGAHLEGCNENLNLTRPDVVLGVHRKYLEAGADIIETNTFGSTPLVLAEYGLDDESYQRHRRRDILAAPQELSRASPRPHRRRRRCTSPRNLPGHAQHQSRHPRDSRPKPRNRGADSADDFRNDRSHGHDARRSRDRSAMGITRSCRITLARTELRDWP